MSVPQPPFHSASDELLYNIYLKLENTMSGLQQSDINTLAKLNAILVDSNLMSDGEIAQAIQALKGNAPAQADTLEKVYNIIQGLNYLSSQDIDTLAEINALLSDADIASISDLTNAINALINQNRFGIGDGTLSGNKEIFARNGAAVNGEPRLRYNTTSSKWQIANNGTDFYDILLSASGDGIDTAWVEKWGNDNTALIGNPNNPFLSIQAAINALPADRRIFVRIGPGVFHERVVDRPSTVSSEVVIFILSPGCEWQYSGTSGNGYLWEFNPATVQVANYRKGFFFGFGQSVNGAKLRRITSGTGGIANYTWSAFDLDTIENQRGPVVTADVDIDLFGINKIMSSLSTCIQCYRNVRLINIIEISSSGGAAIDLRDQAGTGNGILIRNVRLIKSTAGSAIVDTSGLGKVVMEDIGVIESTVAPAIKVRRLNFLKNCEVKCSWDNAGGHAIEFIDDLDIGVSRLMNVRLMVKNAGAYAIKNSKPSASISIELDNILRNTDNNGVIVDLLAGAKDLKVLGLTSANVVGF